MLLRCRLVLTTLLLAACCPLIAAQVKLVPQPAGQDLVRENGVLGIPAGTRNKVLDLAPEGGFAAGREYTIRIRYADCRFAFVTGREYTPVKSAFLASNPDLSPRPERVVFTPVLDRDKSAYGMRVVEDSPSGHRGHVSTFNKRLCLKLI